MFRITNLQTWQQENCSNRDELLSIINEKSVWIEDQQATFTLQLEQLGEEEIILDTMVLSLPLHSIVEEALSGFGLKREKKGFSLLSRNKQRPKVEEKEVVEETIEEVVVPQKKVVGMTHVLTSVVSNSSSSVKEEKKGSESLSQHKQHKSKAPSSSGGGTSFFSKLLPLNAFFISILSITIAAITFWQVQQVGPLQKANQRLTSQLKEIKDYQDSQHEIDLFARYFLPVYYSGDKAAVETYFSKSTFEKLKASPKAQLQSVILEKMTQKDKDFYVTYVIGVLQNDKRKNMRLSFIIHQDKKSDRDWVVTSIPEEADY